jgi:hypothetical protein
MSLRKEIIRLAHQKPELRKHLLPLISDKTASRGNIYTDIIVKSIPRSFKVQNVMPNNNFVYIVPSRKSDMEGVQIHWYVSQDTIQFNFSHADVDDQQGKQIQNVSKKNLDQLAQEIKDVLEKFNFADHWKGYDNYRHT